MVGKFVSVLVGKLLEDVRRMKDEVFYLSDVGVLVITRAWTVFLFERCDDDDDDDYDAYMT